MPSKSIFSYGFEELEVEKLERQKSQAAKLGGSEILFDELKREKEVKDVAENPSQEKGTSFIGDSSGDESDSLDPSGDLDDHLDPTEEESVAREEFRNVTFSLESTDDTGFRHYNNLPFAGTSQEAARSKFAQTTAVLSVFGISLTIKMASMLFRGVLYVFEKLGRLIFAGGKMLAKYLDRRKTSFQALKESIQSLNKSLDIINSQSGQKDIADQLFTQELVINALKIEDSTDFTANIQILHEFVKTVVSDLGQHIVNDISAIKHLAYAGSHHTATLPANIMNIPIVSQQIVEGQVDGYDMQSEFTQSYRYQSTLPSNVVLIAELPLHGLTDLSEITKAYNDSKMILGFDQSTFKEVKSAPLMTTQKLQVFINELDKLCDLCIAHQAVYEKIQRVKSDLSSNFKSFFLSLTNQTQKVSLQESFVEQVYLKTMFIDKVYLSIAMDIHDYTAKIISSGISYAKDNLRQLA